MVISSCCFAEDSTELFRSAWRTCSTVVCPHSINQILNLLRLHCCSCCGCCSSFSSYLLYHSAYFKRETRYLLFYYYRAIFLLKNTKIKDKLSRSYCCRYHNNCPPFKCHFSILQHRLNDLRIFEPIAQISFHSTLKTNHQLKTALRQNHSMNRFGYSVLWRSIEF